MTLQDLDAALKSVCTDTFEAAAPPGLQRYIVWQQYGVTGVYADDTFYCDVPQVQIDVYTQSMTDTLRTQVFDVLRENAQTFAVTEMYYDDAFATFRCIIELEVI